MSLVAKEEMPRIKAFFDKNVKRHCPMCGNESMALGDEYSTLPELGEIENQTIGTPVSQRPVLRYTCTSCGFVALFDIRYISAHL